MYKINLIPNVVEQKRKTENIKRNSIIFSIAIVGVTIGTIFITYSIHLATSAQVGFTKKKIVSVNQEKSKYADLEKDVVSLEAGIKGIKGILNGKNQWTKLFVHLENSAPKDVTYNDLSVEKNIITSSLSGNNVESLSRFVKSLNSYEVISLRGSAEPGVTIAVTVGPQSYQTQSRLDGRWVIALPVPSDPTLHIMVKSDQEEFEVVYDPQKKAIEPVKGVKAAVAYLFSRPSTQEFTKGPDGKVSFEAAFNFDESLLW